MTWVAWRQHRLGILSALGIVAVAVVTMVVMRFVIAGELAALGGSECLTEPGRCPLDTAIAVNSGYSTYLSLAPLALYVLPVLIGIVAGAPLFARELSQGSHMFSLTQSVSRKRWWTVKLAVTLLPLIGAVAVLFLVARWALEPMVRWFDSPLRPSNFEIFGPVAVAILLFAFAVAATTGLVTRNNVAPVVVGLGACVLVGFALVVIARPSYLPPEEKRYAVGAEEMRFPEGNWPVGVYYLDEAGNRYNGFADCVAPDCDHDDFAYEVYEYQPISRFWPFQGIETGIYLVLAVAALGVGVTRLRSLP